MQPTLFERIGGMEKLHPFLWQFYADVRQHQVIGPIFNARIQNWPEHVSKIAESTYRRLDATAKLAQKSILPEVH